MALDSTTTAAPASEPIASTDEPVGETEPADDSASWPEFPNDVPIYPGSERGSGWAIEEERQIDGGWSTTDSFDVVCEYYRVQLPDHGWTRLSGAVQVEGELAEMEGWKGNRHLVVTFSLIPFSDEGTVIHLTERLESQ